MTDRIKGAFEQRPDCPPIRVYADGPHIAHAIAVLVGRLPEEVGLYVAEKCLFLYAVLEAAPSWFATFAKIPDWELVPTERPRYAITFFGRNPVNEDGVEKLFLHDLAYEIAYAWLRLNPDEMMPTHGDEIEADRLYTSWGIPGWLGPGWEVGGSWVAVA